MEALVVEGNEDRPNIEQGMRRAGASSRIFADARLRGACRGARSVRIKRPSLLSPISRKTLKPSEEFISRVLSGFGKV